MRKLKVCVVAVMVEAEDLEVVRVSAGSVVIQAIIHAPAWREALALLAADVAAGMLTHAHACSRMLTYAHVCCVARGACVSCGRCCSW
jgi:hypothetical protein